MILEFFQNFESLILLLRSLLDYGDNDHNHHHITVDDVSNDIDHNDHHNQRSPGRMLYLYIDH